MELKDRREELWERYGQPRTTDPAFALRLVGKRDEVHPRDVAAALYLTREAAEAFKAANEEHWGHPSLGIAPTDAGVLGVIDLRPAMAQHGIKPTDPKLPDKPKPPVYPPKEHRHA